MKQLRLASPLLATASLAWCLFVGWWIWTTPVRYSGIQSSGGPGRPTMTVRTEVCRSFSEVSALGVIPLAVPVETA